jgi:hypothetical protein
MKIGGQFYVNINNVVGIAASKRHDVETVTLCFLKLLAQVFFQVDVEPLALLGRFEMSK